jgi:putative MATE family efflux protein
MSTNDSEVLHLQNELNNSELRKKIFDFSWPIIVELMLMTLISMVNLAMVGHLGAYALSAAGLTNQPVFISIAVFQSINIGSTALISRFIGAKDHKNAKMVVIQTLIISFTLGIVVSVIGFIFSRQIVYALGAKPETIDFAEMYMKYMSIGMIFQAIPTAVTSIYRGAGESRAPMRYNIISNIINVIAGFILIYGFFFIPKMNLEGAALANTIAKFSACVLSIFAILNPNFSLSVSIKDKFKLDLKMLKRIMNIGISAAVEQFTMRIGFLVYSTLIANLGTIAFASHQVIGGVTTICANLVMGLGITASSFTGRTLGECKPKLAERYCNEIQKIGFIISISAGLLFFFAGYPISMLFNSDREVLKLSAFILKIAAFITIPQCFSLVLSGALRGAGDTKWPMFSAIICTVFFRIIVAFIFIKIFNWGLAGAWVAALIEQSVRGAFIYFRFRSGKWKTKTV